MKDKCHVSAATVKALMDFVCELIIVHLSEMTVTLCTQYVQNKLFWSMLVVNSVIS